jgi:isopropylmalate/homocitrate/citramalate synthase
MSAPPFIKLIECPRDAMQGFERAIPTEEKVAYLRSLLSVGFDTLDLGSFVSPKAIPQMADTADVLRQLPLHESRSKQLVIVANERGAREALSYSTIHYLGFPFSVSPAPVAKKRRALWRLFKRCAVRHTINWSSIYQWLLEIPMEIPIIKTKCWNGQIG